MVLPVNRVTWKAFRFLAAVTVVLPLVSSRISQ